MSTKHTYWTCDICKKKYSAEAGATACEAAHTAKVDRLKIKRVRWDNPNSIYPAVVWVKNKDAGGNRICKYTVTNKIKDL